MAGSSFATRPSSGDPRPEMSGHFHPKLRLSMKGRSVSRRCFVASATKLILPAYGAFTGGLDAAPSRDIAQGRSRARRRWCPSPTACCASRSPPRPASPGSGPARYCRRRSRPSRSSGVRSASSARPSSISLARRMPGMSPRASGGVSSLPSRSTKMLVRLPSVSWPSGSTKIVSYAPVLLPRPVVGSGGRWSCSAAGSRPDRPAADEPRP